MTDLGGVGEDDPECVSRVFPEADGGGSSRVEGREAPFVKWSRRWMRFVKNPDSLLEERTWRRQLFKEGRIRLDVYSLQLLTCAAPFVVVGPEVLLLEGSGYGRAKEEYG